MHPVDKKEVRDKQRLLEEKFAELGVKPTMLQHLVQSNGSVQVPTVKQPTLEQPALDDDLEWDNDLTSDSTETRGLLRHTDEEADR